MMRAMSPFLVSTWPTNPPDRCKSLGSALIVTRHLDVTLLRRKYHVTEVGVWGGPTRQATQSCDWLSKETHDDVSPPQGGGGQSSPTAARYATVSGPLSPPSSLLVPPGPRHQTQSPMIMLKPRGPVPLVGGQGWWAPWWLELGAPSET